jgi:hypothetical protein
MEGYLLPILTTIVGIIGTLLTIRYKYKLDLRKKEGEGECPIESCVFEDQLVIEKLREQLKEIKADRIAIYSFHNGGVYYSGKSIQKLSMSYEEISNGIASTMLLKQNIPVSAYLTTLKPLLANGEFHCVDIKNYPEGLGKHHMKDEGVKSTYNWSIVDINNNIIGILRVDFVKRKTHLKDHELEELIKLSTQLPGYLKSH